MNRLDMLVPPVSACVAAASGLGAWITLASEAAVQLFGVPLPVVLAALTGACGARVFLPPAPFWHAVLGCVFWTLAGGFLPQFVLWIAAQWLSGTPPTGVISGIALMTAALGQRVAPILWNKGGAALERKLDGLWPKPTDKGGQG